MVYSVGCVIGDDALGWTRAVHEHGGVSVSAIGSVPSVVGVGSDGRLDIVADDAAGSITDGTSGFVSALGASEPIMIAGTPYGAEALVAVLLSHIVETNTAAMGAAPDMLAIVHDDELDAFRASLLTEAARLAGLPAEHVLLVTRSAATAAGTDGDASSGAASLALARLAPPDADGGGTALAAGATGLAAGAAVGLGAHLADGEVVAAAGTGAGPAGTPLTATGPSGTTIGPTGSSIGPTGSSGPSIPTPRPRWIPAAVVGGAVAVIATVGIVVVAQDDDQPEAAVTTTVTVVEEEAQPTPTTVPSVDSTEPPPETTAAPATAEGWVISENISGIALNAVSCESELGPWTITFDQTFPEGTMTGTLALAFDELGAGTADYSALFVVPGEGSIDMGGNQWPARIEPSGDGFLITMETGPTTAVATVDGGSFSFSGEGDSETATFAVRPATGECG